MTWRTCLTFALVTSSGALIALAVAIWNLCGCWSGA